MPFLTLQKTIPGSQDLKVNGICSDNESFDRHFNDLEKWPMERGYHEKYYKKADIGCPGTFNVILGREKQQKPEKNKNIWHPLFSSFSKC